LKLAPIIIVAHEIVMLIRHRRYQYENNIGVNEISFPSTWEHPQFADEGLLIGGKLNIYIPHTRHIKILKAP
jgi:hypothetical protein